MKLNPLSNLTAKQRERTEHLIDKLRQIDEKYHDYESVYSNHKGDSTGLALRSIGIGVLDDFEASLIGKLGPCLDIDYDVDSYESVMMREYGWFRFIEVAPGEMHSLMYLESRKHLTFKECADMIEEALNL